MRALLRGPFGRKMKNKGKIGSERENGEGRGKRKQGRGNIDFKS